MEKIQDIPILQENYYDKIQYLDARKICEHLEDNTNSMKDAFNQFF